MIKNNGFKLFIDDNGEQVALVKEGFKNETILVKDMGDKSINDVVKYFTDEEITLDGLLESGKMDDYVEFCEFRVCSECGDIMRDGYVVDGGREYYCSDKCLEKRYTQEEWEELYNEGNSDSYYTEW